MYTVTLTRPYLTGDDRFEIQRERISARDEQQVRDIFADCEIISIEADCEEELEAFRRITPKTTEADADAIHNYIVAAEAGDRAALAYGDADLGTRYTISGGEVLELDAHLESRYDEQNGGDDLPF